MKIKDLKDFLDRECEINPAIVVAVSEGKSSKGTKYLSITLQDNTGTVEAKKWDVNPGDEELLSVKSVVRVTGYPLMYNGTQLQYKISDVDVAYGYNEEDLVLDSPVDKNALYDELVSYLNRIKNNEIKTIVSEVFNDVSKDKVLLHPAAKTNHHEYSGGLLHHEVSMLRLADAISKLYPTLDTDYLFGGIILHDLGKLIELSGPIATEYTFEGRLIGHISLVASKIQDAAKKHNINSEVVTILQHIALSHHGKLEYGSPVLPLTLEAEVIYQIDNIDSKIVMISKALKDVEEGGYSNRVPGLENRSFYKPHK